MFGDPGLLLEGCHDSDIDIFVLFQKLIAFKNLTGVVKELLERAINCKLSLKESKAPSNKSLYDQDNLTVETDDPELDVIPDWFSKGPADPEETLVLDAVVDGQPPLKKFFDDEPNNSSGEVFDDEFGEIETKNIACAFSGSK